MIPALIAGGMSLAGSLIGGRKAAKAQQQAQTQALQAQALQADQQQRWARENAQWSLDQNKQIADQEWAKNWQGAKDAVGMNRVDQTSEFGNVDWTTDPTTGAPMSAPGAPAS